MKNRETKQKNRINPMVSSSEKKEQLANNNLPQKKEVQKSLLYFFEKSSKQKARKTTLQAQLNSDSERKQIYSPKTIIKNGLVDSSSSPNNHCPIPMKSSFCNQSSISDGVCWDTPFTSPYNYHESHRHTLRESKIQQNNSQQQLNPNIKNRNEDGVKQIQGNLHQFLKCASNNKQQEGKYQFQHKPKTQQTKQKEVEVNWNEFNHKLEQIERSKKLNDYVTRKRTRSWLRQMSGDELGHEEFKSQGERPAEAHLMLGRQTGEDEDADGIGVGGISVWVPGVNRRLMIMGDGMRNHLSRTLKIIMESYI